MQTSDKLTINKKTSCFKTPFLILLHLIVVITVIGCGGNNGGVEPRIGDTIYTEKYALKDFSHNPQRALMLIDSAVIVGNINKDLASMLTAKVFVHTCDGENLDTAFQILESLMASNFVKGKPANREMVLDLLVDASRLRDDNIQYLRWATEKIDFCRQQKLETEALRTEAEIGVVLTRMGEEEKGLSKINGVIANLDSHRHFDEMDACIIALKRKAKVLNMMERPADVIPTAWHIIYKVDDYRLHSADYDDGSYRMPASEEEVVDYCNFYSAQAHGYLARAFAEVGKADNAKNLLDSARLHLDLYEQSDYAHTFDGRKAIAPTLGLLGKYGRMFLIFDEVEKQMGDDTITDEYATILKHRALAADFFGNSQASRSYWQRYSHLDHLLAKRLLASRAYEYAARYHLQEEQMKTERERAKNRMMHFFAVAGLLLALIATGFVFWLLRQRRATERKNRLLVEQIAQVTKLSFENVKLKTENNAAVKDSKKNDEQYDFDAMSDEELFSYISDFIRKEKLYLDPAFERQTIVDKFHVSKNRIGAAFSQGSQYKSLSEFIRDMRLEYACRLLTEQPEMSISDIAATSGFSNITVFGRDFKNKYDVSPSYYRSQTT